MTLKTRIFTHHPHVSLARLTFCWWRHNRLAMTSRWQDHCDTNTWQVISNSFDIDFIHGDIHGRVRMRYMTMSQHCFFIGLQYISINSILTPIIFKTYHVKTVFRFNYMLVKLIIYCVHSPLSPVVQDSLPSQRHVYLMLLRQSAGTSIIPWQSYKLHNPSDSRSGDLCRG